MTIRRDRFSLCDAQFAVHNGSGNKLAPVNDRLGERAATPGGQLDRTGERMVIAMVRVVVPESKRAEVLQALRLLRGPTAARMGCDSFHVYRDDEHENALLLLQQWASEADLDRYIRSDLYSTILAVIETAIEPPDIRFDTIAATAGVELVTAVRHGRATR